MGQPIPSLAELQQYNVNRPNQVEAIRSSLYDTVTYAQAGQTSLQFFQIPMGQSSKTYAETNMSAAGSLPSPKSFLVETIEIYFRPGELPGGLAVPALPTFLNDVYEFYTVAAWLELFIGSKAYLDESPLLKFPPRCGLSGFSSSSDAASTVTTQTGVNYASAAGPIYELDPPILLVPTQNFSVTLNWPTANTITAAALVTVNLGGILYRNSQ